MAMSRQERVNSQKKQYRIDSVKQAFKDDISISVKPIRQLQDDLDGATFDRDKLTTSSTPTVDELESCVGSLAGKVNEILLSLKTVGIVK